MMVVWGVGTEGGDNQWDPEAHLINRCNATLKIISISSALSGVTSRDFSLDYWGNIEDKAGLCNKNNVQIHRHEWSLIYTDSPGLCRHVALMQFLFTRNALVLLPVKAIKAAGQELLYIPCNEAPAGAPRPVPVSARICRAHSPADPLFFSLLFVFTHTSVALLLFPLRVEVIVA